MYFFLVTSLNSFNKPNSKFLEKFGVTKGKISCVFYFMTREILSCKKKNICHSGNSVANMICYFQTQHTAPNLNGTESSR